MNVWVVYSWSGDTPAYCAVKCVCNSEEEAKKHADKWDDIEEKPFYSSAPTLTVADIEAVFARIKAKEDQS